MTDQGNGERPFMVITNRMIWDKLNNIEETLSDAQPLETKKRVRSLELKFYGILAALVAALIGVAAAAGGTR